MADGAAAEGRAENPTSRRVAVAFFSAGSLGTTAGGLFGDWTPVTAISIALWTLLATAICLIVTESRSLIRAPCEVPSTALLYSSIVADLILALLVSEVLFLLQGVPGVWAGLVGLGAALPGLIALVAAPYWGRTRALAPSPSSTEMTKRERKKAKKIEKERVRLEQTGAWDWYSRRHVPQVVLAVLLFVFLSGVLLNLSTTTADDGGGGGTGGDEEVAGPTGPTVPPIAGDPDDEGDEDDPDDPGDEADEGDEDEPDGDDDEDPSPDSTVPPTTVADPPPEDEQRPFVCHDVGEGAPGAVQAAMARAWREEQGPDGCQVTLALRRGGAWVQFAESGVMTTGRTGSFAFTIDATESPLYGAFAGPFTDWAVAVESLGAPLADVHHVGGGMIMIVAGGSPEVYTSPFAFVVLAPGSTEPRTVTDKFAVEWLLRGGPCGALGWPTSDVVLAGQDFEGGRLVTTRRGRVGVLAEIRAGTPARDIDAASAPWPILLRNVYCQPAG